MTSVQWIIKLLQESGLIELEINDLLSIIYEGLTLNQDIESKIAINDKYVDSFSLICGEVYRLTNQDLIELSNFIGYFTDWKYYKILSIDNTGNSNELINYQIKITLTTTNFDYSKVLFNGDDLRFVDSDKKTLLNYWIESWNTLTDSIIWVKIPIISALSTKQIYMYYNNPLATKYANGNSTFIFYDDCTGIITDKWETILGTPTYSYSNTFINNGIWYDNGDSYHGGMATAFDKIRPMGIYSSVANKTFFVYANSAPNAMISYYDHVTGLFATPIVIGTLTTQDAHKNPSLLIDEDGYIYVFYGSHVSTCYCKRSNSPLDISLWTAKANILEHTYPQVWQLKSGEIIHYYRDVNDDLVYRKSTDSATTWGDATTIVNFADKYVYNISIVETGSYTRKIHFIWTAYDAPNDTRKNIWYAYSDDGGTTYKKKDGTSYELPIVELSAEKIYDSGTDQVGTSDIQLDSDGNPYILISVGTGTEPGSWIFKLLKYKSGIWYTYDIASGDHQFDQGSLVIINDNDFRVYLPTIATQIGQDGGDIEEYKSTNQGETWSKVKNITTESTYSHNFVKTIFNSNKDFRCFWSYGNSISSSDVNLYYYGDDKSVAQKIGTGSKTTYLTLTGGAAENHIRVKDLTLTDFILDVDVLIGGTSPSNSLLDVRETVLGYNYNVRLHTVDNLSKIYKYTGTASLLDTGVKPDHAIWGKWTINIHDYNIIFYHNDIELINIVDVGSSVSSGSIGARVFSSNINMAYPRIRNYTSIEPLVNIE